MPVCYVPVPLRIEFPMCTAAFQENAIKLGKSARTRIVNTSNQFGMFPTVSKYIIIIIFIQIDEHT
jgi:hypothetical protein